MFSTESYSSLERVGKNEENSVVALRSLLNVSACGQVSSPRLYRLMACALVLIKAKLIIKLLPSIFERLIVGEQVRLGGLRL